MSSLKQAKYRQLPKGKFILVYLGNLFLMPNQGWHVAVWLRSEDGQVASHSFRFEALPDLRVGQQFVDGVAIPAAADRTFTMTLPSIASWRKESAAAVIPSKLWSLYGERELCQQNVFVITQGGREYVLPVIELARALLVPKKVIAKHLLTPSGLSGIAVLHEDQPFQGATELKFKPDTPLYLIEDIKCRNTLVWLLRHEQPGKLFGSVYQHLVEQQNMLSGKGYKRFIFNMDTPELEGVRLHYTGPILGNTVFIREIVSFSNLPPVGFKSWLSHPAKKESVQPEPSQGNKSTISIPTPANLEIDEQEEDTGTGGHSRFVDIRPVSMNFIVEPDTEIIYNSSQVSPNGNSQNVRPFEVEETLTGSLGDPSKDSNLKPVEYGYIHCSDQDKTGGLKLFKEVVKELAKANGWGLSMLYFELPNVTRSNFKLIDDRPRQAGLASFRLSGGQLRHLLEVQISDGRYLSTLLLKADQPLKIEECREKVKLLLWAVVKGGGHWKEGVLKPLRKPLNPLIIEKITHPKKLREKSRTEALCIWKERLQSMLKK